MRSTLFRLILLPIFLLAFFAVPQLASAQFNSVCDSTKADITDGNINSSPICTDTSPNSPITGNGGIIDNVTNIIAIIAGIVAVVMVILAGYQLIFSGGDSQRIHTARNTIIFAIVGLVVIALAHTIVVFIVSKVG